MPVKGQISNCIIVLARSCARGKRSVRLASFLSQSNFWSAEAHRDPRGDKPHHELAGVTGIVRQVIRKRDAISSVSCHDPHLNGRSICRKAVPVHRKPMSPGKVDKHSRIATCGNDPPGRRTRLEPVFFEILLPRHTLHAILSIQDVVCSTVAIKDAWRGRQLLEAASGFLATRAIAGGGQNRPADCLQFHLAASAGLDEAFLLFLVHGSARSRVLSTNSCWRLRRSFPSRLLPRKRPSIATAGMPVEGQKGTVTQGGLRQKKKGGDACLLSLSIFPFSQDTRRILVPSAP